MCRENQNIWWYFFIRRTPIRFMRRKPWKSGYFWQDSFWKYWNKLIGCKIHGHKNITHFKEGEGCTKNEAHWYCFNCQSCIDYLDTK